MIVAGVAAGAAVLAAGVLFLLTRPAPEKVTKKTQSNAPAPKLERDTVKINEISDDDDQ